MVKLAAVGALMLIAIGCQGGAIGPDGVEEVSADSLQDVDDLPQVSAEEQAELDHWRSMSDQEAIAAADEALSTEAALDVKEPATASETVFSKSATRCGKIIHAVFSVNTGAFHLSSVHGNGCWTADEPTTDSRYCHENNIPPREGRDGWYYDDTNPYNSNDVASVRECANGTRYGYEAMAYRDGSWRLVHVRDARAYFAELYTSDDPIDDLARDHDAMRVFRHTKVYPMLNFGPRDHALDGSVARQTFLQCKRTRSRGFVGFYYGDWRHFQDEELRQLVHGMNACTRR